MRIYVAGPYTAATPDKALQNVETAMDVGLALIEKGHTPFIPHLTHYLNERAKRVRPDGELPYYFWLSYDNEWLRLCDALYFIDYSPGADMEKELAIKMGLRVYYNMSEVPNVR